MRHNGLVWVQAVSGGGVNADGEPVPCLESWGEALDCLIRTNTDNRKGKYVDGEFRAASFTVLLEGRACPCSIRRVRLQRACEALGEYDVISVEPLFTVGRMQITV